MRWNLRDREFVEKGRSKIVLIADAWEGHLCIQRCDDNVIAWGGREWWG
jgi:hypothetical protein